MGRMSVDILRAQPKAHCWYSTGGRLLGMGCWNGGHIRNFPLLPFWAHCANGSQSWGDPPTPSLLWW